MHMKVSSHCDSTKPLPSNNNAISGAAPLTTNGGLIISVSFKGIDFQNLNIKTYAYGCVFTAVMLITIAL